MIRSFPCKKAEDHLAEELRQNVSSCRGNTQYVTWHVCCTLIRSGRTGPPGSNGSYIVEVNTTETSSSAAGRAFERTTCEAQILENS